MYTYPISPQARREHKITMIKDIFQQLKFISKKLKPLPVWIKVQIYNARRCNGKKLWYNDIFDALYEAEIQSLEIISRNLKADVEDTAKQRMQSA